MKKNMQYKAHRQTILIGAMIIFILFSIGFASANIKSYDTQTKTVEIKSSFLGIPTGKIADVKLNTPLVVQTGFGGVFKVAEFEITNYKDYESAFEKIEFYDVKSLNKKIDRTIEYKIKSYETVDVNDYEKVCDDSYKNGTKICSYAVSGTHEEQKETWSPLEKADFSNGETKTIGIFTYVNKGDYVEWIPTFYGVRIDEWASWSGDLYSNLQTYWKFDEATGTIVDTIGVVNLTATGSPLYNRTGKINGAIGFNASGDFFINSTSAVVFNFDATQDLSFNVWINSSDYNYIGAPYFNAESRGFITDNETGNPASGLEIAGGNDANQGKFGIGTRVLTLNGIPLNQWVMITMIRNNSGKDYFLFVNGVYNQSLLTQDLTSSTAKGIVFNDDRADRFNNVFFDEFGFWKGTALTQNQITYLYGSGNGCAYGNESCGGGLLVILTSPSDYYNQSINSTVVFNSTVSTFDSSQSVQNVTLYLDGSTNETNTSGVNGTYSFIKILSVGTHTWSILAYNNNSISTQSATRTVTLNPVTENSQTYNNQTIEGNIESFVINITYDPSYYSNIIGRLVYNGTSYTGTKIVSGSNIIFNKTITIPSVTSNVNKSFYWNFDLIHNSTLTNNFNSTTNNQSVLNFAMDDCTTNKVQIFNFTLKDEDTQTKINETTYNTTIRVSMDVYTLDRVTLLTNYSTLFNQTNPVTICINASLPSNVQYKLDSLIEYQGDDYAHEYYNIQDFTLKNSTVPQAISLYDLLSTRNQPFKITYKDSAFLPVKDALINIQRKYISEGVFKTVEIPKTDANGETIGNLVVNDAIYNFIVSRNGVILGVFNDMRVVCQNPTIYECVINLNSYSSSTPITNFTLANDFNYILSYDNNTRTITATFTVLSGTESLIVLNVTKEDASGTNICTDSVTTNAGTLTCVIPITSTNGTAMVKLYKNGVFMGQGEISLKPTPTQTYGSIVVFLSIFIMITLIGAGMSGSPVMTILFFMVGVILLFALNLASAPHGFIYGATILFLIVAIILVIIKGGNRQ